MTAVGDSPRRRGRRAGGEDTRAALVDAARVVFAEQGFQGATVRAIAARAGVDAAMVNHWFGGKQGLFAATVELPFDPRDLVAKVTTGDPNELAERLIRTFVTMWDTHEGRFASLILSISSQELAAKMMVEFFSGMVFTQVAQVVGVDRAELRASLCATQVIGLGVMRYVLKLEPIATASVDSLVEMIGPTLRRYLTADL
jgi:AcrR family transcriptional regulator